MQVGSMSSFKKCARGLLLLLCIILCTFTYTQDTMAPRKNSCVAAHNEECIRSILKRVGVDEKVLEIRRFTKADIKEEGWDNAYIYYVGEDTYYFYISEDWFETLTEAEKIFLIAHEAMHIKLNHFEPYRNPRKKEDAAILREQEKEADQAAVALLRCLAGAIAWLKRMHKSRGKWWFESDSALDTHPRFTERITLLTQQFAQQLQANM